MKARYKKARVRFAVRRTLKKVIQNNNRFIVSQFREFVKRVRVGICIIF